MTLKDAIIVKISNLNFTENILILLFENSDAEVIILSIYMGFRLKINGVHWYFKDLVQAKFGHPHIV